MVERYGEARLAKLASMDLRVGVISDGRDGVSEAHFARSFKEAFDASFRDPSGSGWKMVEGR